MIDPKDYWVNNPLITPVNKALMYDNAIFNAAEDEKERIIKLLEALKETRPIETNTNYWGYSFERVIALIKGEK